jgi:hypothetical protein
LQEPHGVRTQKTPFFKIKFTLFNEGGDNVRFEVFTAVTMKNVVFGDVTRCGSCKSQRFGGTYRLLHHGDKNFVTLMKEALRSSETSVLTRVTLRYIPEDAIFHGGTSLLLRPIVRA